MARGGARPGAGRPRLPEDADERVSYYRNRASQIRTHAAPKQQATPLQIPDSLLEILAKHGTAANPTRENSPHLNPFRIQNYHPPAVIPPKELRAHEQMAMDNAMEWAVSEWSSGGWLQQVAAQGLLFPGYPFLSELAQRPEYDAFADIIATEMTRKWIKHRGRSAKKGEPDEKADKIQELESFMDDLGVRAAYKNYAKQDCLFGRAHLFHEIAGNNGMDGAPTSDVLELQTPLTKNGHIDPQKVNENTPLTKLTTVEPVWVYPTTYNANNPLAHDFYNPTIWYTIGGRQMHASRMPCLIGRPVPDLLKPAYSFGGLSMSQLAMPYVDIWLDTRAAIGRLIKGFSTPVLMTDLQTLMQPGGAELFKRAALFNSVRDNMSLFILNKATEDFKIEMASLAGLHELQAQAQEHLCIQAGTLIETDRGAVPIEDIKVTDLVLTRQGFARIKWAGKTGYASSLVEIKAGRSILRVTPCHPVWCQSTNAFVPARNVSRSHRLLALATSSQESTANRLHGVAVGGGSPKKAITATGKAAAFFMTFCGRLIEGLSQKVTSFITETRIRSIIKSTIWNLLRVPSTSLAMCASASTSTTPSTQRLAKCAEKHFLQFCQDAPECAQIRARRKLIDYAMDGRRHFTRSYAWDVENHSRQSALMLGCVPINVDSAYEKAMPLQPVYNLEVEGPPEFFANGILVHNCSVSRIPSAIYTGLSPTGLNASSEGEIRIFENTIHAYQESRFRPKLNMTVECCMLSLWGHVDEDIIYDFVPLREMTEKETAEINKMKAETDDLLMNGCQAIGPEEVRVRVAGDADSGYDNIDPDDEPELPQPDPLEEQKLSLSGHAAAGAGPGAKKAPGAEPGKKPPPKAANDMASG